MLELAAVSRADSLTAAERGQLHEHLRVCAACREAAEAYEVLCNTGRELLQTTSETETDPVWDHERQKQRLLASFQAQSAEEENDDSWNLARNLAGLAAAAAIVCTFAFIGYQFVRRQAPGATTTVDLHALLRSKARLQSDLAQNQERLRASEATIESLTSELAHIKASRAQLKSRLASLKSQVERKDVTIEADVQEKQALSSQLAQSDAKLRGLEQEMANVGDERARDVARVAAAEQRMQQVAAEFQEKDRTLAQQRQFLESDRDIRDLMGARQLLIADVVDVDRNGNSRSPFGRIFYTKGKSLIFYGFDLDQQAGIRTASVYQAWGHSDAGGQRPVSLGIFYLDNEANRRWILKADDPAVLAEIDAVFVTVEPRGASKHPTSKPFLYTYLKKSLPNHP
jgi:myosin heavy subunit